MNDVGLLLTYWEICSDEHLTGFPLSLDMCMIVEPNDQTAILYV